MRDIIWFAVDKDKTAHLFFGEKPFKSKDKWINKLSEYTTFRDIQVENSWFPDMTWDDNPIRIDIIKHC